MTKDEAKLMIVRARKQVAAEKLAHLEKMEADLVSVIGSDPAMTNASMSTAELVKALGSAGFTDRLKEAAGVTMEAMRELYEESESTWKPLSPQYVNRKKRKPARIV